MSYYGTVVSQGSFTNVGTNAVNGRAGSLRRAQAEGAHAGFLRGSGPWRKVRGLSGLFLCGSRRQFVSQLGRQ